MCVIQLAGHAFGFLCPGRDSELIVGGRSDGSDEKILSQSQLYFCKLNCIAIHHGEELLVVHLTIRVHIGFGDQVLHLLVGRLCPVLGQHITQFANTAEINY